MTQEKLSDYPQPQTVEDLNGLFNEWTKIQEAVSVYSGNALRGQHLLTAGRLLVLRNILESKGLAICYYDHVKDLRGKFFEERDKSISAKDWKLETIPHEEGNYRPLGIYPSTEMRMLYCDWRYVSTGEVYPGAVFSKKQIEILCPEHFSRNSFFRSGMVFGERGEGVQVEVIEQGSKLLTVPDYLEVPRLPIRIEGDDVLGPAPYYDEIIYKEFEIPGFKFN